MAGSPQVETQESGSTLDQRETTVDNDDAALFEVEGRELTVLLYRGRVAMAEHMRWGFSLERWDGETRLPSPIVIADTRADTPDARPCDA